MSEATLSDVLTAVQTLDRKVDAVQGELTLVHGIVRQTQRELLSVRGDVQMLIDANGMFRLEYLREHPGGGH